MSLNLARGTGLRKAEEALALAPWRGPGYALRVPIGPRHPRPRLWAPLALALTLPVAPAHAAPPSDADVPTVDAPASEEPLNPVASEGVPLGPEAPAPQVTESPEPVGAEPPAIVKALFELPPADPLDPYGPRPPNTPVLSRSQVLGYAMHNPLVQAAGAKVEAMEAQARKAKWSWLPVIQASAIISPGVSVQCDDVRLQTAPGEVESEQIFRYCRSGDDINVQTVRGYLQQLGDAGVAIRLSAEAIFPLFTFGKIKNAKKAADIGVAAAKLEEQATRQETRRLVAKAIAGLLLARESIHILDEGWKVLQKERKKMAPASGEESWETDVEDAANPTDVIKLEVGELELARRMREARKMEALALSALWTLAGDAAPRGFDLEQQALSAREPEGGLGTLADYQEMATRQRPESKMASALVEVRRVQERLARSNFLPDLGLVVGGKYGYANAAESYGPALYYTGRPNFSSVTFALGLQWTMDFHNRTFDLQMARAQAKRSEFQRDAARRMLLVEVEQAYRDFRAARDDAEFAALAREKSWQLVVTEQQRDTIGGADFDKLSKALISWAEYEFDHFEAIQTQNVALAALERAVGESLASDEMPGKTTTEAGGKDE